VSARASSRQQEGHGESQVSAGVAVLGGGPGGYTAAFRAADLGLDTVLIDNRATLGGVCLNVGCIPSKALLHVARVAAEAETAGQLGLRFGAPEVDLDATRAFKDAVVQRLTTGLATLAEQRGVRVITGSARLRSPSVVEVDHVDGATAVSFEQCIIAVGSSAVGLPGLPRDPRVMDSTAALQLADVPGRLLVIGGGIIGLEMATVYDALGAKVTVVEQLDALMSGADSDLVAPLYRRIAQRYEGVHLSTRVESVSAQRKGLVVSLLGPDGSRSSEMFDRVLVAVGRRPNGATISAENTTSVAQSRPSRIVHFGRV